ncbi:MAG: hypothetical protein AAGJ46_21570 [Planctomycetota bacterium]
MRHWQWHSRFPDKHAEGWPVTCLESWLESFIKWEDADQPKELSSRTLGVIRGTMQVNLLYIRKLEAENAALRNKD